MHSTGTRLYVVLLISCTCQLIPLTTGREFVPSAEVNNMFQNFRKMAFRAIEGSRGKKDLGKHNPKFQEPVPLSTDFPCPTNPGSPGARSSTRPTSVHQLRPGDIDVIGALGGEGTWREYLTLPNILKEFNPNLVGYSLGTALGFMKSSKLNIAEPMAMNRDMLFQAKLLILRMKDNPRIDFKEDWKVNNSLYNDKDDFAVVVQPFLLDAVFPTKTEFNETVPDSTVYAQDCFHLSQKGHAYGAQSLWNNMMEPAGNKSLVLAREILTPFPCPSEKHPYIYTAMNSDDDDDDDDDDE
ncbi:hypothetical protein C0J52_04441 [Blattella germanica]|nr:hypothetical protein C0J52_04441 [Blattella germanica]